MQPLETEGREGGKQVPGVGNEELHSLLKNVQDRRRQWNQAQEPQRSSVGSALSPLLYLFLTALGLAAVFGIMSLLSMRVAPGGASPLVSGTQQEGSLCSWDSLYLPEAVLPLRYDLNISARLNSPGSPAPAVAHGQVAIRVRAAQPTKCLVLNAGKNLNISSVRLMLSGGQAGIAGRVHRFNPSLQQAILELDDPLPATDPGPVLSQVELRPVVSKDGDPEESTLPQLLLDFSYSVQPGLDGFYASMYTDENGAEHPILSTQFEAVAARKAFPCWDEPRFKARFATVLAAPPPPYVVLSNMPVREEGTRQRADGLTEYTFQVSPPMASYLVAWVIGELGSVARECGTEFGTVPLHVWSTPDKVSKLQTAADVGCTALRTLSSTFGVPFVLPKLDLVGIPNFAAGAMENWGLITYRETALLVDTSVKPNDIQQDFSVATVVSHEIVHQWFGNLVTCADWSELWLNEGFAMYFENLAASAYKPSYGYFSKFFTEDTVYAFAEDTLGSHPMSGTPAQGMAYSRLKSLAQADAQFDGIEYEKGAAVIRMLRAYLTAIGSSEAIDLSGKPLRLHRRLLQQEQQQQQQQQPEEAPLQYPTWQTEPFLAGLHLYLTKYEYSVGTNWRLWEAIAEATGEPIQEWMATWTLRSGYPVLKADIAAPPVGSNPAALQLLLEQQPMSFAVASQEKQEDEEEDGDREIARKGPAVWWLPIAFAYPESTQGVTWTTVHDFSSRLQFESVSVDNSLPWALLNVGRYGFYRVNYTEPVWSQLAQASTSSQVISAVDYAGLLSDSYRLSESGQMSILPFLQLLQSLGPRDEVEYSPWTVALHHLRRMRLLLSVAHDSKTWAPCVQNLDQFTQQITEPFVARIRASGLFSVSASDTVDLRLLRPSILMAASRAGDPAVRSAATELLGQILRDEPMGISGEAQQAASLGGIHPDVRGVVYSAAAMSGDSQLYAQLHNLYTKVTSPEEEERLLGALTWAATPSQQDQLLSMLLSEEVKLQDVGRLLGSFGLRGGRSFEAVWSFILSEERFGALVKRFTDSGGGAAYSLGRVIGDLAAYLTDGAAVSRLEHFASKYDGTIVDAGDFMGDAKAYMEANLQFYQSTAPALCSWLKNHV